MKHSPKLFIILILLTPILGIGVQVTAVSGANYLPPQQSARDPRFGAIESFWAPGEAAELGVGWERILFYWNEIQPNGPGDWNTLHVREEWLVEANNQGRQVVGLLKNTPNWATDGEFASGVPRGLYLPVTDPGNLWAHYVRQVASYYGPRGVHNWIVWNEPDIAPDVYGHEFSGSTEEYYQLVKVAYQVIKQADPQAKIHIGGMTHWHDPGYIRKFLQVAIEDPDAAANNYFFDVITYHIYFRPETIQSIVGNGFAAQQEMGISPLKQVWINETNARPSMDPEWPVEVQAFHIDLEQQAWFIPQAFAHGFYAGANHIAVYKLIDINMSPGDESWGLIWPYDFSKRPAFTAYQNTIKHLAGFQYPIQRVQQDSYFQFSFNRPEGVTRILWARNPSPVALQVPALADSGLLVDPLTGAETSITAVDGFYDIQLEGARCHVECLMGGPPVFLLEAGATTDSLPNAPPAAVQPTSTPGAAVTAVASLTPTATITAPVSISATATAPATPTPSPTGTAKPTLTASATAAPTNTSTATVTATAAPPTPAPVATEVAEVPPTPVPATAVPETTAVATVEEQASFWFLGAGLGLGLLLLGLVVFQRRQE